MRRRLAVVALAATALIVISFVVPLGILVRRQTEDRSLSAAESEARSVATALAVASSFAPAPMDAGAIEAVLAAFGSPPNIGVHLPDGTVVGDGPVDDPDVAIARTTGSAFTARTPGGAAVLVPLFTASGTLVVRADVSLDDVTRRVRTAWAILAALGGFLVLVAVAAADRLGRSIVDPVGRLRRATAALAAGDLDARVVPGGPTELVEVGAAFNELADRLGELLQEEREAAADISHGLRTPVAALRLQVEAIREPELRASLLDDITGLEVAVGDVIRSARSRGSDAPRNADLAAVARERAVFWQVLAAEQDRDFTIAIPDRQVPTHLTVSDLTTIVDTLIENVFAHTPPGTAVSVGVADHPPSLTVEDGGPGFAPDAVARGSSRGGPSTGLGLDIVRRIATHAGGHLAVDRSERLGGARVLVTLQ